MSEIPTVDEQYSTAVAARSLLIDPVHRTQADVIIAAGWSHARIGTALMRLRTEWDSAARPAKPTPAQIEEFARTLDGKPVDKTLRAHDIVGRWWMHEMRSVLAGLKTLPSLRAEIARTIDGWAWKNEHTGHPERLESPEAITAQVLLFWLDHICPACSGRKFLPIKDTPTLGPEACKPCHGTGIQRVPHGDRGRRILNWMDQCVVEGRNQMRGRLRQMHNNPN